MTTIPTHSDGTYCAVAARYREGQQSDGDCEQSHHWMQSDVLTHCDLCRSTSPCNHLNRCAYVPYRPYL